MTEQLNLKIQVWKAYKLVKEEFWPRLHEILLEAWGPGSDAPPKGNGYLHSDARLAGKGLWQDLSTSAPIAVAFDGKEPIGCAALTDFVIQREWTHEKEFEVDTQYVQAVLESYGSYQIRRHVKYDLKNTVKLTLITVTEKHRHKGVAGKLLQVMQDWAREKHMCKGVAENGVEVMETFTPRHRTCKVEYMMVRGPEATSGEYLRKLGFKTVHEFCVPPPKSKEKTSEKADEMAYGIIDEKENKKASQNADEQADFKFFHKVNDIPNDKADEKSDGKINDSRRRSKRLETAEEEEEEEAKESVPELLSLTEASSNSSVDGSDADADGSDDDSIYGEIKLWAGVKDLRSSKIENGF